MFDILSWILTSMLSLMTRLRYAEIYTFVSEERELLILLYVASHKVTGNEKCFVD